MSKQVVDLGREIWRSIEVREFLGGIGQTKFWYLCKQKDFPKHFTAGRSKLWFGEDIKAWAKSKVAEARQGAASNE